MGAIGYVCILCLSERATTMPNVYMLELLMIAGNHSETRIAVELYATPCDVACDDAIALAGLLGGRTDERSRQDDSEEKYAPMTEAHAMGKTSFLPSLSGRCSWDPTMSGRQWAALGELCGRRVASREVGLQAHPH